MEAYMKKRKITMLFLIAGLLFSGCGKSDASDATDISSVKLKSSQKIVIGKITEIAGNEMTYTILKKVSAKSSSSDQSKSGNSGNAPDQSSNSNDSGSSDTNGSSNGSGGMPAMQNGSSKSKSTSKSKSNTNSKKKSMTMYTSTNKSATMTIPVGTDVITSLGNKTTFSRLSNGDVIKMIVETDQDGNKVIVGIWMV